MERGSVLLAMDVLLDVFLERDEDAQALWELLVAKKIEGFHIPSTCNNVVKAVLAETGDPGRAQSCLEQVCLHVQVCSVNDLAPEFIDLDWEEEFETERLGEQEAIQELLGVIEYNLDALVTRTRHSLYRLVIERYPGLHGTHIPLRSTRELVAQSMAEESPTSILRFFKHANTSAVDRLGLQLPSPAPSRLSLNWASVQCWENHL